LSPLAPSTGIIYPYRHISSVDEKRQDPLAHRRRIRLIGLADRDFVEYRPDSSLRSSIDQACRTSGLQRRVVCEVDTMADLVELVALGLGVSLLPPAAMRMAGDRAIGLATDPSIPRDLMLVTLLDREPSPAGAAFLDLLDSDLNNTT
jgi:DNA-binding transcriptional LysR family regulator